MKKLSYLIVLALIIGGCKSKSQLKAERKAAQELNALLRQNKNLKFLKEAPQLGDLRLVLKANMLGDTLCHLQAYIELEHYKRRWEDDSVFNSKDEALLWIKNLEAQNLADLQEAKDKSLNVLQSKMKTIEIISL